MNAIFNFDAAILLWLQNSFRNPILNPIMVFITHLGDAGLLWTALTLLMLGFRKTRKVGVASMISMVIGLIVVNIVLKNWVARVRPYELIEGLNLMIGKQHDFSFPSGHATNSLACAWVLFRQTPRKYGVPALAVAILICLSRLYVGIHYPTDVLGGAAIGICAACLSLWLSPIIEKKIPLVKKFYKL
jgi:undecaprenyl-diphosphatase